MDDSESIDLADVPAYIDNLRARIAALEAAREEWREWAADILASYESDRPPRELRPSNAGTEISEVFTKIDAERDGLRERLAAAVDTLLKYGQHLYDCDGRRHSNYACDCGFKAAIAKAEGREEKNRGD